VQGIQLELFAWSVLGFLVFVTFGCYQPWFSLSGLYVLESVSWQPVLSYILSSAFVTDGRCLWLLLQSRRQQTTSSAFVLIVSVKRDEIPVVMWTTSSEPRTDVQNVKYLWFQLVNGIVCVWHFTVLIFRCQRPSIFGSYFTYENFYMYTCLGCWVSCMDDNICHMEHFMAK
jgi:hypothetical protein